MDRHIELSADVTVAIQQRAELGLGGSVWDGALTLCALLAQPALHSLLPNSHSWRGQRVCELGAGTGVCGIAAAALGADSVLLTDHLPPFIALMRDNVAVNQRLLDRQSPPSVVECALYKWGDDVQPLLDSLGAVRSGEGSRSAGFDVLLLSECVYEQSAFQPLLHSIDALTQLNARTLLLVAYEKRKRRELWFWRRLFGFVELSALPAEWLPADFRSTDIAVLAGRRREATRSTLSDDGSDDWQLGEFFASYNNDAVYLTREEEKLEKQQRMQSSSR